LRRGAPTSHDLAGMEYALRLARAAAVRDEVPVGCVVMSGSEVLGEAHNETIQRGDPMAHAEMLALQRAMQAGHGERLSQATLYVTLEPCAQCAGGIVLAKVGRVVFGAWDQRAGMAGSVYDILRNPRLNHRPEVITGLFEEECGEVLKKFFRAKRG
jgi:tRNA(adenine34) deaminase